MKPTQFANDNLIFDGKVLTNEALLRIMRNAPKSIRHSALPVDTLANFQESSSYILAEGNKPNRAFHLFFKHEASFDGKREIWYRLMEVSGVGYSWKAVDKDAFEQTLNSIYQ